MKGIIIYSKKDYEKNRFFVEKSIEHMSMNNIGLKLVFDEEIAGVLNEENRPDFAIVRCINPKISKLLELNKIKVFNNAMVSEYANHKYMAALLGKEAGLNVIPTMYSINFPTKDILSDAFDKYNSSELIVKSVAGHGGSEVFLVNTTNIDEVICNIRKNNIFDCEYVIQPRVEGVAQDVRVYILDNKPVSAILRSSSTDYRSNFSLGGDVKEMIIDDNLSYQIKKLTDIIYMDYAGVDFIIDKNNRYYFNEIEDVVGARMLYKCTNIDIIARFMDHIIDKLCVKKYNK